MGIGDVAESFCGNKAGFVFEGGIPTFCGLERQAIFATGALSFVFACCCALTAWLASYVVFLFLILERFFEIHKMAVSCPPSRLPFAFLLLLGVVLAYVSVPPPVLWLSLGAHAVLWGLTHCLIRMEFSRFLPQCRLSVRGFWSAGGLEGLTHMLLFLLQQTAHIRTDLTFEDLLKTDHNLASSVYTAAVSLHLASSACQVLLLAVCLLHPNDLPLELLPFVARLLSQGSATLPCYTFPDPHQPAGLEKKGREGKRSKEAGIFSEAAPVGSAVCANDSRSNPSPLSPSEASSACLLDASILNVVLTEVEASSVVVHAEYKIQMRSARRAPWIVRRRFRSFVELSRKLQAAFPAFVYPELAAVLPRLPPRDPFSDAVVSESAFWISELQAFLEVPEDLRPALSTQRLVRLSELQHPSRCTFPFADIQPTGDASAVDPLERTPVAFPVAHTSPAQATTRRWLASVASRSDASEGVLEAGSCSALSAAIWRLRICKEAKAPYVVHDISCTTVRGVFYSSRRYKQFVQLRQRLRRELCVSLPALPGRLVSSKRDYLFHEQRRMHLEMWLKQILADGACAKSPTLLDFLGVDGSERESSEEETNGAHFRHDVFPPKEQEKAPSYMVQPFANLAAPLPLHLAVTQVVVFVI
ncbi:hypothetical protein Emag_004432 [Eimeria magna]